MSKLLTTLALILGLLLGGVAAPAVATEVAGGCVPGQPCEPPAPTPAPSCLPDETAAEYRALIATQAEWIEREAARSDRLQRVAERRAATIARLRAKIRALR
jgi:hypothetical protein